MKIVREISRILVGLTFVFSGFVKAIDPLGSTYKFTDYLNAFGSGWATKLSFILAVLLAIVEFGIGIGILLNYRMKIFAWFGLLFMGFFLPLTLYIAVKNPVADCGCFGDAIILSNWDTFYKNIVLFALALLMFISRKKYRNNYNIHFQNGYFIFFLLLISFVQHHSYNHLPLIDFRAYKIGANLVEGMQMPVDAKPDVFKTEFVYRNNKTGKQKKFSEKNYPWKDTINWEYISADTKLVKKGYEPPVKDFAIENFEGENVADFYLYDEKYTFILVAYNLEKANVRRIDKIVELANEATNEKMNFICLTSSDQYTCTDFAAEHGANFEFFNCDEITLKTIIRSNPGLLLLKEGTVVDKWHWKDIPRFEKIQKELQHK